MSLMGAIVPYRRVAVGDLQADKLRRSRSVYESIALTVLKTEKDPALSGTKG